MGWDGRSGFGNASGASGESKDGQSTGRGGGLEKPAAIRLRNVGFAWMRRCFECHWAVSFFQLGLFFFFILHLFAKICNNEV